VTRRDFVYLTAAAFAHGQSIDAASPIRTWKIVDTSLIPGKLACQDIIFDRDRFVSLYHTAPEAVRGMIGTTPSLILRPARNRETAVAATSPEGKLLWSYRLPQGMYLSLGTHKESVVIFALSYVPESGKTSRLPVLSLDPQSGSVTQIGTHDGLGFFNYAGDSRFLRIVSCAAEIWRLDGGLVQEQSGITSATIAKKFSLKALTSAGMMAIVDAGGTSMAMIDLSSGSVSESVISSTSLANSRAEMDALYARHGKDQPNQRMASTTYIGAICGDQSGGLYATITSGTPIAVTPIIRLDASGTGSDLGAVKAFFGNKMVVNDSELAVVSSGGDVVWYNLPFA